MKKKIFIKIVTMVAVIAVAALLGIFAGQFFVTELF